jgi:hypothetical protein
MARIEQIKQAGYRVITQCECEFDEKPELLVHPIIKHAPLVTRDALYGGRTEAMRLHYKILEWKESVQYCDVMSLYQYICKYFKFPIGHPTIHVGNVCVDKEACLKMEGLMKCTIVPPKDLYHPVLPFRRNQKLFSVCADRVSFSITRPMNVDILAMLKDAWMARGLLMKSDWLLPNVTKF